VSYISANEKQYGPIADAAATKYGLDTTVFRNLIRSESSFDPTAINPQSVGGQNAIGIAQFLPSTAAGMNVDPLNPFDALDGAAKYLSDLSKQYGLSGAIAKYKGYSDINSTGAATAAAKVMGVAQGDNTSANSTSSAPVTPSKAIWSYSFDDLKTALKSGTLSLTLGFMGLLIIAFSIYAIFAKGASMNIGAKVLGTK
jgi:hypothetical protein